ncbi:unnamed protein product [Aphis gossypii]|uniref:CHHC U11-48K-type domain-containing protein n=2 Tax=Aphis gossypii TaxID=80765 RepID=A0A9P0NRT9_APHGO|nr:unnamed protein product [Aphis gossypii]
MESRHLGQDPTSNVVHCPFNTSHSMPRKTLVLHLTKCPDRVKNKQNNSNTCKKDDIPINQNQCMLKPQPGLTKAQRKQYRLKATQQYANIDLSYNPNLSIRDRLSSTTSNGGNTRQNSTTSNGGNTANQRDQQIKKDGLFFGKRPNN